MDLLDFFSPVETKKAAAVVDHSHWQATELPTECDDVPIIEEDLPLHERLARSLPTELSVIASETGEPAVRCPNLLLRPIFINGVEIGYKYAECVGAERTVDIRGCLIIAVYFILRGHCVKIFLPDCYQKYPGKCTSQEVLSTLMKMNLIHFTKGSGVNKYHELGRVLTLNAYYFGGCIVACSSMKRTALESFMYAQTIAKWLLTPTFIGQEVIFPPDGPEGRGGLNFWRTIECSVGSLDYQKVTGMQMSHPHQIRLLNQLSSVYPNGGSHSPSKRRVSVQIRNSISRIATLLRRIRGPDIRQMHRKSTRHFPA